LLAQKLVCSVTLTLPDSELCSAGKLEVSDAVSENRELRRILEGKREKPTRIAVPVGFISGELRYVHSRIVADVGGGDRPTIFIFYSIEIGTAALLATLTPICQEMTNGSSRHPRTEQASLAGFQELIDLGWKPLFITLNFRLRGADWADARY
jgi:hypothetical protein